MQQIYSTTWQGDLAFATRIGDHLVPIDAREEHGGANSAPNPKPLMVAALAGCTGIDVLTILKKMQVEVEQFSIDIEATLTDDLPSVYSAMHIIYHFVGKDLDAKKIERAVSLSQDKYCGVSAMYKKAMELSYEIRIVA